MINGQERKKFNVVQFYIETIGSSSLIFTTPANTASIVTSIAS